MATRSIFTWTQTEYPGSVDETNDRKTRQCMVDGRGRPGDLFRKLNKHLSDIVHCLGDGGCR